MSEVYEYKSLTEPDSIRLIELQPSSDPAAKIHCSLIHTTLSSEELRDLFTHYTALSYVWGSPEKVETIWINEASLKITRNLFAALCDLRDETRRFLLWADGICINQEDNDEKGAQVQLMGQIYEGATNTIVYLGPATVDSHEHRCLSAVHQEHTSLDVDLLFSIFSKEWFTRVWVFQELVFAENPWVQCGNKRVKWEIVCKALLNINPNELEGSRKQRYEIASKMYRAWQIHQNPQKTMLVHDQGDEINSPGDDALRELDAQGRHSNSSPNTMIELVSARRGLGTSDPRDMVFAHIGFASDGQDDNLRVNYSKTCVQVYTDFALFIAKKMGWAALLDKIGDPTSRLRLKDLPSWVPDWTVPFLPPPKYPNQDCIWRSDVQHLDWQGNSTSDFLIRWSYTIVFVSSELRIAQIPRDIRENLASRISKIDIKFLQSGKVLMMKEDITGLRKIWPEVYEAWRRVVDKTNVLPSAAWSLDRAMDNNDSSIYNAAMFPFAATYLILAFHTGLGAYSLTGRALALTNTKQLILVPAFSQREDMITSFIYGRGGDTPEAAKPFVFRPIQLFANNDNGVQVEIERVKVAGENSLDIPENSGPQSFRVVNCQYIGGCSFDIT